METPSKGRDWTLLGSLALKCAVVTMQSMPCTSSHGPRSPRKRFRLDRMRYLPRSTSTHTFCRIFGAQKLWKKRAVVSFAGDRGNVGVSRDGKRDTFFPLPSSHDIKSDLQRRESRKFLARVDIDKKYLPRIEMRDIVSRGWGTKRANFLAELLFKWPFSAPLTKRTGPCEIVENLLWAGLKGHSLLSAKF